MSSALNRATLLAGHAVSYAEGFLAGRIDAVQLKASAERLELELATLPDDPMIPSLINPVRLLSIALARTAAHALVLRAGQRAGENSLHQGIEIVAGRLDRWKQVTAALTDLVRHEAKSFVKAAEIRRAAP